jgi:hypothetical protein
MDKVYYIALAIHILSVLGILGLLLSQVQKNPRKLSPGIIHASLTALVAGIVMVSLFSTVHPDEELNNFKIAIKSLLLTGILFFAYANSKKESVKTWVWGSTLALTVINLLIALSGLAGKTA